MSKFLKSDWSGGNIRGIPKVWMSGYPGTRDKASGENNGLRGKEMSEILFKIATVGVGAATAGIFILINLTGAVYVYEHNKWVLYLETIVSVSFVLWAGERLFQILRNKKY